MATELDPFFAAARDGDTRRLQTIVEGKRVNVNTLSQEGFSALYLAAMRGHVDAVRVLLRGGAIIDAKGEDRETPLYIATRNNHIEVVDSLLTSGALVNEQNGTNAETALHCAARMDYVILCDRLIKAGANVNCRTARLETPLFLAAKFGKVEAAYRLLQADANRTLANDDAKDPMFIASECDQRDIVQLLKADKKFLKETKSIVDAEIRARPPTMVEVARRVAVASEQAQADALEEAKIKATATAAAAAAGPAAASTVGASAKRVGPTPPPRAARTSSVTPTRRAASPPHVAAPVFVEVTPVVPVVYITADQLPQRTHDPLTGKSLPACRTMLEAGVVERPPPPPELTRPIDAPKPLGTTMVIVDGDGNFRQVTRPLLGE